MQKREDLIIDYIRDKSVLDLGNSWGDFKDHIQKYCASYAGLDLEPGTDYVADLNVPIRLGKKFDVIVAGELIEHLENIGVFLDNVRRHLRKGGVFFLTTPNTTSFRFFVWAVLGREPEYSGHVTYYTKDALELLLSRYFSHVEVGFTENVTNNAGRGTLMWRIKFATEHIIGTVRPRLSPNLYAACRP